MAFSTTLVSRDAREAVFTATATLDADAGGDITHGLGAVPAHVAVTPILAAARVSDWIVTAITATVVTLAKTAGAGSGAAGAQVRVSMILPADRIR